MKQGTLNALARRIIAQNRYLTLATAGPMPWAAPVYYAVDDHYTFYFISQLDAVHVRHIFRQSRVAFAIFDSHQPEGTGNGVQGAGIAAEVAPDQLPEAFKWYQTTYIERKPSSFQGNAPYRFFTITPEQLYVLDPDAATDKRVEVSLREI